MLNTNTNFSNFATSSFSTTENFSNSAQNSNRHPQQSPNISLSYFPIPPSILERLSKNSIVYVHQLSHLTSQQLSSSILHHSTYILVTGITVQQAENVKSLVTPKPKIPGITFAAILKRSSQNSKLESGISRLDQSLGGGFSPGHIIEVLGVAGMAKTQFSIQMAIRAALPPKYGGLDCETIFVDTEGGFSIKRAQDIVTGMITAYSNKGNDSTEDESPSAPSSSTMSKHSNGSSDTSLCAEEEEDHPKTSTLTTDNVLSKINYIRIFTPLQLIAFLHLLPSILDSNPKVRVLVFDSIAFHFRSLHVENYKEKSRVVHWAGTTLANLANSKNLFIFTINHMTSVPNKGVTPALGKSWSSIPGTRILFHGYSGTRCVSLLKDANSLTLRNSKNGTTTMNIPFEITSTGLVDLNNRM